MEQPWLESFVQCAWATLHVACGMLHGATLMSDVAGKFSDAELIARKAHIKRIHVLGVDHPDTLTTASNLASILAYQCKFTEAEAMLTTVLATSRRVLGPAHPQTQNARKLLDEARRAAG